MWLPPRALSWLLALAILVAGVADVRAERSAERDELSVLILLPGQPGLPAATSLATGIRAPLLTEWSFRVSLETEHVDLDGFTAPQEEIERLRALYGSKYRQRPFDLVVAAGPGPLGFVLQVHDALWPGAPVIVCAVDDRVVADLAIPAGLTLLTMRYDMEATVAAALALLPDTRHVALVGGAGPNEQSFHALARRAAAAARQPLQLLDLTNLPIAMLLKRVSALPDHTVVLVSSYQMDGAGRRFYGLDIIGALAGAANRPTFTVFGNALGRGVVGGGLVDFEGIGREAGQLALRALRGEALPPRVAGADARRPRFDARALARWGLDERRLPPGSEVWYREPTLWQLYRWHVVAAVTVVCAQAALIALLVVERHRRRQARAQLAERLRFEALVSQIGAALTVAPAARMDEQIEECLRRVATFLGVDRGTLWQPVANGTVFEPTHVWSARGVAAPAATLDLERLPYLRARLAPPDGALSVASAHDLSPEAVAERAALHAAGIRAFAAVPLHAEGRWLGILLFASVRADRAWSADVMHQLRMLAEHFANALVRLRSAAALESSTALTSAVLGVLPGETAIIDASGVILETNEAWDRAASALPTPAMTALAVGGDYLHACRSAIGIPQGIGARAAAGIESVLRGEQEDFSVEYSARRHDDDRWFELRVRRVAHLGAAAVTHLDVTKRVHDEAMARRDLAEMAHLDRVAALGQLASSIAHELNQPLAAILTNAQAAQRMLAGDHADVAEMQECLNDIVSDDQRAGEVIRRMRRLLKKSEFVAVPFALNDIVANTIGLVASDALAHRVSIEFIPASALPVVHGDVVQIQQVVLNLLTNAIAAAASSAERKVTVQTSVLARSSIELSVCDSGRGIAEEEMERLFEPFFTTKADGLGMGLAIARRIVEAHDGRLLADNDPAGGARFRVQLRLAPLDGAR